MSNTGSPADRELRLAMVMTGGVSLAVWMGGVSAQVYRATRRDGLYDTLCEITATDVVVDIISGASAGGLNGALLGVAIYKGLPSDRFDGLRELWMKAGSFADLLRNPFSKDPPSLLRGDEYFTAQLKGILTAWMAEPDRPDPLASDELAVTLTGSLLSPDTRTYADDFGATIVEPLYRARFNFTTDSFRDPKAADRLALAARSSASFPGAFEPSFVPVGQTVGDRPDMAPVTSFSTSRWVVDGGVLMNEPVQPALEAIERRRADREVRRVLAYVNPNPGPPKVAEADQYSEQPRLATVVLDSLVTLPRSESIAAELDEVRDRNRRFGARRQSRDELVWGAWIDPTAIDGDTPVPAPAVRTRLGTVAGELYPLWVRRRHTDAARSRLLAHLATVTSDWTSRLGANTTSTFGDLLAGMEQARISVGWLPPSRPVATADATLWHYGFTPLEYLVSVALDLVRRAYALLPRAGGETQRSELGAVREAVHKEAAWLRLLRAADDDYYRYWLAHLVTLDPTLCAPLAARALYQQWPTPPTDLFDAGGRPAASPERQRCWAGLYVLARGADEPPTEADVVALAREVQETFAATYAEPLRRAEARVAHRLAGALVSLGPVLREAVTIHRSRYRPPTRAAGACEPIVLPWEPDVLAQTADVLGLPESAPGAADVAGAAAAVLEAAFDLFVVHTTTTEDLAVGSSRIDFVQVAATVPDSVLDQHPSAAEKVAGLKLGHFGAFLKASWRANDWMWGELDGVARLVPILLDPARLKQLYFSAADGLAAIERVVLAADLPLADDDRRALATWWGGHQGAVAAELAYLDAQSGLATPSRLPRAEQAVARTLQLVVAARDLPVVADAVDQSVGGARSVEAATFVERVKAVRRAPATSGAGVVIPLASVPDVLKSCHIASETIGDELASDAGAATAMKAAAVTTALGAGSRSGLGPLRGVAASARTALMGAYLMAVSAGRRSRVGFAAIALVLAAAAGAIAARLLGASVPNGVLVLAAAALALWVLLTGATARAWPVAIGGALAFGAIALALIDRNDVCAVFATTCPPRGAVGVPVQPGWKGTVSWLVPALLAAAAVIALWRLVVRLARGDRGRNVLTALVGLVVLSGLAAGYYLWVHDWLFEGDATQGARKWAVQRLEGWSGAGVVVVLVGLPAVSIALGVGRQQITELRAKSVDRQARRRARQPA